MTFAEKGSQYQIQKYVNEYSSELNKMILQSSPSLLAFIRPSLDILWKSPLSASNFYEYQDDFLRVVISDEKELEQYEKVVREHWPRRGPVWDAVATIANENNEKGLLLVEAKAHLHETFSQMRATSDNSRQLIERTIQEAKAVFRSTSSDDPWLKEYYQLANRLSFLYILNEKLQLPTWLVLCNFVEDSSHVPTSVNEWLRHYREVYNKMGIDPNACLMNKLISIYVPSIELKG